MDLDGSLDFECPVCLQVLDKPIRTLCGHVFCQGCHQTNFRLNRKCPICRGPISRTERRDTEIEKRMVTKRGNCRGCDIEVCLSDMRAHMRACSKYLEDFGQPSGPSMQPQPTPASHGYIGPNRLTYTCPYCQATNYDICGLVQHCCANHYSDRRQVVCPICASMPWGDANYYSRNFINHLMLRHQFSYDFFVLLKSELTIKPWCYYPITI
uniref:E3 ubiquitin-protein ligase RNF114-like isoform X2 n=1 Tax=Pristiophorus japonicus TaxID=55135 RepID=UPI00398EF5EE